jgi:hypothetical protein
MRRPWRRRGHERVRARRGRSFRPARPACAEPDFATAAARLATVGDEFEPDQERAELYSERYERFLELREPAEQSWRALSGD